MSHAIAEPPGPPPLDQSTARAHAAALQRLAAEHGIGNLRFAGPGRLVGHVAEDCGMGELADFQIAVEDLLGRDVDVFADRVLQRPHVSPDLVAAKPL